MDALDDMELDYTSSSSTDTPTMDHREKQHMHKTDEAQVVILANQHEHDNDNDDINDNDEDMSFSCLSAAESHKNENFIVEDDFGGKMKNEFMEAYASERYIGGGIFSTSPLFLHEGRSFVVGMNHVIKVYHTDTGNLVSSIVVPRDSIRSHIIGIYQHPASKLIHTHVILLLSDGTVLIWNLSKQALAHDGNALKPQLVYKLHFPQSHLANINIKDTLHMDVCKSEETPHFAVVALFVRHGHIVFRGTFRVNYISAGNSRSLSAIAVKCLPVVEIRDEKGRRSAIVDMRVSMDHNHLNIITRKQWVILNVKDIAENVHIVFKKQLRGDTTLFTRIAHSRRGMVAAGDSEGHIYIYSMATDSQSKQEFIWNWHSSQIRMLMFSNDGNYLYSSADESILITWDIGYNLGSKTFTNCLAPVTTLAVTETQDRYVAITNSNALLIIDPARQKPLKKISGINLAPPGPVSVDRKKSNRQTSTHLIVDPVNPQCIVIISGSNVIQWFDVLKEQNKQEESVHFRALSQNPSRFADLNPAHHCIIKAAFSQCGQFMAHGEIQIDSNGASQHVVRFWRKSTKSDRKGLFDVLSVADQAHDAVISCIVFHPLVPQICVTCSIDGTAKLWTLSKNYFVCSAVLRWRGNSVPCLSAAFSKDGSLLMLAFGETVTMWNMSKMTCVAEMSIDTSNIQQMSSLSDNTLLLVRTRRNIHIVSLLTMQPLQSICSSENMRIWGNVAVHSASKQVAVIMKEKTKKRGSVSWYIAVIAEQEGVKHLIPLSTRPLVVHWLNDGEHLWILNGGMEIHQVSTHRDPTNATRRLNQKQQMDTSAMDTVEEQNAEDFDGDTWVHNVRQSLSKLAFEKIEHLKQQERQTHAFDPDRGVGAWKQLFNASSHSLVSTSSVYASFMDTFLLKRQQHGDTFSSRLAEMTASHQSETTSNISKKASTTQAPIIDLESKELKKTGRRAARLPTDLADFLTEFPAKVNAKP